MKLLYGKKFSKDLDDIRHDVKTKKRLLELIRNMKNNDSPDDLINVRKIEGYSGYYRIRIGDYRLGIKITGNQSEYLLSSEVVTEIRALN